MPYFCTMHDHGHHHHHHHSHTLDVTHVSKLLVWGIVLNIIFVIVEFGAGFWSNSLALLSDAGHNVSDVANLALALLAFKLLTIRPTARFTYGYRRASILISLLNAVILLIAVGSIGYEAVFRFLSPRPVQSGLIIIVAGVGIVINALSALLFFRNKEDDLNLKGAYLHLMVDALVSVGVVISGVIIHYTQWYWVDPVISLVIMVIIVGSTWSLLRDSLKLSMDAVPQNVNIDAIREAALKLPGIKEIHHIHVWALSTAENALTAHLVLNNTVSLEESASVKHALKHALEHLGIQHATLETEHEPCDEKPCATEN